MILLPKNWPPRDWRMLYALALLAISGGGAWLLAKWSLDALTALSIKLGQIWPLAYFGYLALAVLAITPLGMAMVVALKSFRITAPGGSGLSADGDAGADPPASVVTTTETRVGP